jgi:hypothetical protein
MRINGKAFTFIIVLIAIGFIFYQGWLQFKVGPENCGVLVSKTGGINTTPILPGSFSWRWEPLLPTNAEIRVFSLTPYTTVKTVTGNLPSSDVYGQMIKQNTDFSYSIKFNISLKFAPSGIIAAVKKSNAKNDSDIATELDKAATLAAQRGADWLIGKASSDTGFKYTDADSTVLLDAVKTDTDFPDMEFVSYSVMSCTLPDMLLYGKAKDSFDVYRKRIDSELAEQAGKDAAAIAEDERIMIRLSKLGEILRKYPELSDVIKNEELNSILKTDKIPHN